MNKIKEASSTISCRNVFLGSKMVVHNEPESRKYICITQTRLEANFSN